MLYMLDTKICNFLIKKKPAPVIERLRALQPSDVGISSITLAELMFGVAKSARPRQNRDALAAFLAPLEVADFSGDAAACYGTLRAALERQGRPIGAMDMLIAAHALCLSITLVTNNTREFARVPGLRLEDWTLA